PLAVKETFFFDRHFNKGSEWYWSHFEDSSVPKIEVAPSYFAKANVPERVCQVSSRAKIIVTLRHPVKRAWSHYLHLRRYGYTMKTLRDACDEFPQILQASCYNSCLTRWRDSFGDENVYILWQEDMLNDIENY